MAEQQPHKRFLKGLFKDTAHIDQPEGTWRYAKNAIVNDKKGAVSNEGGNQIEGSLPNPLCTVIGIIEITNDKAIIFYTDEISHSRIGKWEAGIFQNVYVPDITLHGDKVDLKFNKNFPIEGTFNINPEGELIVYWTDDLNPPRAFNIDKQISIANLSLLYGISPITSHNNHIDLLNLFPNSGPVPHIDLGEITQGPATYQTSVKEGGGLLTGVYYLSLAYVDDSYTATNFLTMSNPISIVDEGDHIRPTTKKDGAKVSSQTSKAITWEVTNMNTDYKFIRPVIIRKMGEAVDAYRLNDIEIPIISQLDVVFSGIEGFTSTSLEDVIIDTISYETAKTINQLDGILYVGNTTSVEDLGYQKYANNIKLNAITKTFDNFDENVLTTDNLQTGFNDFPVDQMGPVGATVDVNVDHSKSYRYVPNIFNYKGYMRDEVYAFYIAFILNDGSMSYAYHIPGREDVTDPTTNVGDKDVLENEGWFKEFAKLSPSYIRKFHLHDFSTVYTGANLNSITSLGRNMNYWENATELYPNTDNFEVWDGVAQGVDLKGLNVRHHHFPSNGNPTHKTIHDNTSVVTHSQGIINPAKNWASDWSNHQATTPNGLAFAINYCGDDGQWIHNLGCSNWKTMVWNDDDPGPPIGATVTTNPTAWSTQPPGVMGDALWKNNRYFVADQPMTVRCRYKNRIISDDGEQKGKVQIVKATTSGISVLHTETWTTSGSLDTYAWDTGWTAPQDLDIGDKIYVRTWSDGDDCVDFAVRHMQGVGLITACDESDNWIQFNVVCAQSVMEDDDVHDVKLSHTVKALGFELEDIKIPREIADKVQGFRIFRAKRKHEDKRILGQGVVTPMRPDVTVLGQCEESYANPDAGQVLSSSLSTRESIYTKDPFTVGYSAFPFYPIIYNYNAPSSTWPVNLNNKRGYKSFSFNDFNLLRTQNSLAGATHIKPEYLVRNFAWNGPTINQPKKMLSKIVEDDGGGAYSEPIKKIEQFWGWEKQFNCYAKEVKSAIFAGCFYIAANSLAYQDESTNEIRNSLAAPRLIGQKAKSYIPGDSIFQASALGFGGKISNEFGESSIIFSLLDTHEIYTSHLISKSFSTTAISGLSSDEISRYGYYHRNTPSILVNPRLNDNVSYNTSQTTVEKENDRRSQALMSNLHAFKTDVYKSIDNQELVWTGFEVLGNDLNNFIFEDDGGPAVYNNVSADYYTGTIDRKGIFGGDTYICRYGFRSTLQHNSVDEDCKPMRAIHYHIVESPDNINFRHTESDADLYFPGSISKRILTATGDQDFTHQDNLNYDDSYSSVNDLRPAFPLPIKEIEQTEFPTRAHRSVKRDTTSLTDNYRLFLANEYKDAPKNRGDLWKLSTFNNLLYFHMEESLYVTKGKQQMQMKDGSEAFVGSGDIFQQEPDEVMQADKGYGGTQSQWAALTTNYGYFFVDVNSRKVFLMKDKLTEISTAGLEKWFKDNLPFALENFSYNAPCISKVFDNPIIGLGLTAIYDPKFKRILLTKKDLKPTAAFITGYNLYLTMVSSGGIFEYDQGMIFFDCEKGQYVIVTVNENPGGPNTYTFNILEWDDATYFTSSDWTISYYPEFNVWCSFHDYTPYIYFNTSEDFYSINKGYSGIWEHNSDTKGSFYGTINPFEFEYIHNEFREEDSLLASFNYTLETFNTANISVLEHGFTSFFVYNTMQISADAITPERVVIPTPLEYLVNIRRIGNNWKINNFRDMANIALDNTIGGYYMSTNTNIIGGINTGTITTSSIDSMFIIDGMSEIINPSYINTTKEWQERRKFIDKWAGIRLIYNNISNNLLNLYSAKTAVRKTYK